RRGTIARRPRRSQRDPARECGDLLRAELPRRGHLGPFVFDGLDQQALLGLAGHHGRTRLAALQDGFEGVEPQTALLLLLAMTGITILGEERPDAALEELFARGLSLRIGPAIQSAPSRAQRGHRERDAARDLETVSKRPRSLTDPHRQGPRFTPEQIR